MKTQGVLAVGLTGLLFAVRKSSLKWPEAKGKAQSLGSLAAGRSGFLFLFLLGLGQLDGCDFSVVEFAVVVGV